MAGYRDELEKLGFSREEKAELVRRLTAGRPAAENRRMRLPYRGLVAVVAAVSLLVGAAGAVSLVGVSPAFRAFFGITDEEQARNLGAVQLDLVFEDQNGSGAAITVKEVAMDQERLYILMEFAAPEGVVIPLADQVDETEYNRAALWGERVVHFGLFADEACTQATYMGSAGYGFTYVEDTDPTDNRVEFIFEAESEALPEDAAYCLLTDIQSLYMWHQGVWTPIVEGMDFTLTVPLAGTGVHYDFRGRCGVHLGGVTLAVVNDLSISPISVTFDLLIPDEEAYEAALAEHGPWEAYIMLRDGTRVDAQFQIPYSQTNQSEEPGEEGTVYFRADHVRLALEHPIDLSQLDDIVFVGDNDKTYDGVETGRTVYFTFQPSRFENSEYWSEVNERWRTRRSDEAPTSEQAEETSPSVVITVS